MAFFLSGKKLDLSSGEDFVVIINEKDADEFGVNPGDVLEVTWSSHGEPIIAAVDTTDTIVKSGEIGFYEDIWTNYDLDKDEVIKLNFVAISKGRDSIKKKLLGKELDYEDFFEIMQGISSGRLGTILTTFFAAVGYSPGFNEQEIEFMTKALAETGDTLSFDGIVADKHSIGGVAGKGITPIVIPIIASIEGIKAPNTSTRAITSASATTDMLEVLMPMTFNKVELEAMVFKSNTFMVWGGGLALAPADDEIIKVQKPLGIESIDKFVSSIVAKKIAQGVNHVIFDIPVGPSAKIREEEFPKVKATFERICKKFGIKVVIHKRKVGGIDGYAVGPSLECREFLRVYENHPEKSKQLEKDSLEIAGKLIELIDKASPGKGFAKAREILRSGQAAKKFREILKNQGGDPNVKSNDMKVGKISFEYKSEKTGKIRNINNKIVFEVARALGNPRIKEAGLYFHEVTGDSVKKGDKLVTMYASSEGRMELGKKVMKNQFEKMFDFGGSSKNK